jgi:DNA-binding MarR family transcriptional regulator
MTISQALLIQSPTCTSTWHEIDIELFAFIERYATNLPRWDLLLFFGQNPSMSSNIASIAERIGRAPSTVQKELDNLAYLGILQADRNQPSAFYSLSESKPLRSAVLRMAHELSPRQ